MMKDVELPNADGSIFECDHLELANVDRELIRLAVGDSKRVYLAPMDKGLSGSAVWQARWRLPDTSLSKLHVFKIGELRKLQREESAIINVASVVDKFPLTHLYPAPSHNRGLLRQEFAGSPDGKTFSLRNFFQRPELRRHQTNVTQVIDSLYQGKLAAWHYSNHEAPTEKKSIDNAIPWLRRKADLEGAARRIGKTELDSELRRYHGVSFANIESFVEKSYTEIRNLKIGPVHGDLHATNVNLDENLNIHLIDFALCGYSWRALDFLMLESALKFIVSPAHAPLDSLLSIEALADDYPRNGAMKSSFLYQDSLTSILDGVTRTRYHCIRSASEPDNQNYRAGLICVAAAFTSLQKWVNHRFLFHSMAFHMKRLNG